MFWVCESFFLSKQKVVCCYCLLTSLKRPLIQSIVGREEKFENDESVRKSSREMHCIELLAREFLLHGKNNYVAYRIRFYFCLHFPFFLENDFLCFSLKTKFRILF